MKITRFCNKKNPFLHVTDLVGVLRIFVGFRMKVDSDGRKSLGNADPRKWPVDVKKKPSYAEESFPEGQGVSPMLRRQCLILPVNSF